MGKKGGWIFPDKIFRISKRRACNFLDSSCGISGEASFVIASGIGGLEFRQKQNVLMLHLVKCSGSDVLKMIKRFWKVKVLVMRESPIINQDENGNCSHRPRVRFAKFLWKWIISGAGNPENLGREVSGWEVSQNRGSVLEESLYRKGIAENSWKGV